MNDPQQFDLYGLGYSVTEKGLVVHYPMRDEKRKLVRKPDGSIQYAGGWPFDPWPEAHMERPYHQLTDRALLWRAMMAGEV